MTTTRKTYRIRAGGREIEFRLARTEAGSLLFILESPLGNGQEIEAKALRDLGIALVRIADLGGIFSSSPGEVLEAFDALDEEFR